MKLSSLLPKSDKKFLFRSSKSGRKERDAPAVEPSTSYLPCLKFLPVETQCGCNQPCSSRFCRRSSDNEESASSRTSSFSSMSGVNAASSNDGLGEIINGVRLVQLIGSPSSTQTDSEKLIESFDSLQSAPSLKEEDGLHIVWSDDHGWLYCGMYDGFNGSCASNYISRNLFTTIEKSLKALDWSNKCHSELFQSEKSPELVRMSVKQCLKRVIAQTEIEYKRGADEECKGELDNKRRQELLTSGCSIGSIILRGNDLYTINIGGSRALLASRKSEISSCKLCPETTASQISYEHAGYLKEGKAGGKGRRRKLRMLVSLGADPSVADISSGIFRPKWYLGRSFISTEKYLTARRLEPEDSFVVLGSESLFYFFSNDELVHSIAAFQDSNPGCDPAKFVVDEAVRRAARKARISFDKFKAIPIADRKKYHGDLVCVVVALDDGSHAIFSSSRESR